MWFAFDEEIPIGFMGVMPDVNQILAKLKNGKLNLINKLRFLYYKKKVISRIRIFVGGAHPEYQNKGIPGALFIKVYKTAKAKGIKEIDLSWVGDYNKKMQALYNYSGATISKRHITYLKIFDSEIKFERFDNEFEGKLY